MIEFDNVIFMETSDKAIRKRKIKDKVYISHKGENFYAQLKYKKKDLFPDFDIELSIKDEQLFYSYRKNSSSKRMVTLAWRQKWKI